MLSDLNFPPKLRQQVDQELQPGESIRWIQQPIPKFFTLASLFPFCFAIPWTSFAIFWMWGAAGAKLPDLSQGFQARYLFPLFGLPFVLIGIALFLTPLWSWLATRQTVYLITDRRAILIQGGRKSTYRSYEPSQLQNLYRSERPDGSGNVIITQRAWRDSDGDQRTEDIGFINIHNAREAEMYLKQLARRADERF